jgi:hypothetical protein
MTKVSGRLRPLMQARLRGTPIQIDRVGTFGGGNARGRPLLGIAQDFLAVAARQVLVGVVLRRGDDVDRATRRVLKAHRTG